MARLAAWVLVLASLSGCIGRSPRTEFYVLSSSVSTPAATRAPTEGAAPPVLAIEPVGLPRYLDRPQIARRVGPTELEYDEFRRWAGGLRAEVGRVLVSDLGLLLADRAVRVVPQVSSFDSDYRLLVDVERFEAGPGDEVTLAARWAVLAAGVRDPLEVSRLRVVESVGSGASDGVVEAHAAALGALSRAIAADVRAVLGAAGR